MVISIQSEIVDDSEPEREEIRKQERNAKKLMSPRRTPRLPVAREVIEITDDEESDNPIHAPIPICKPTSKPTPDIPVSLKSANGPFTTPQVHSVLPHNGLHDATSAGDTSSDDGQKLNVAQFVYTGAASKPGPSRTSSSSSAVIVDNKPAQKKRPPATHKFSFDFSDADLAKLKKCVSCEINWTTRKTGGQKISHIQSCGKKNAYTNETIRVLIQKEIDIAVAGKDKVPQIPRTFYEDIVAEPTRKKKGRHLEVIDTVQSVAVARSILRDRARAVLGSLNDHPKSSDEFRTVHTQSIGRIVSGDDDQLLATQVFGQSALGQTHLHSSKPIFSWSTEPSEEGDVVFDALSPTQTFVPSRSGRLACVIHDEALQQNARDSQILAQSGLINRPYTDGCLPLFLNADTATGSTSARGLGRSQTLKGDNERVIPSPRLDDNSGNMKGILADENVDSSVNGWNNDEAYLHFEPQMETGFLHPSVEYQIMPLANEATIPRKQKRGSSHRSRSTVGEANPTGPTPRRAFNKTQDRQEEQDDDKWEACMKERLTQDHDLHFRILRYEPIHFDIFLKLASNESTKSGKFKTRLRSFLDKQAINFYGADVAGRRR